MHGNRVSPQACYLGFSALPLAFQCNGWKSFCLRVISVDSNGLPRCRLRLRLLGYHQQARVHFAGQSNVLISRNEKHSEVSATWCATGSIRQQEITVPRFSSPSRGRRHYFTNLPFRPSRHVAKAEAPTAINICFYSGTIVPINPQVDPNISIDLGMRIYSPLAVDVLQQAREWLHSVAQAQQGYH
jgi:hypothetical protein